MMQFSPPSWTPVVPIILTKQILPTKWYVSEGEITGGQGTPSISVHVPSDSTGKNLQVTVRIGGLTSGCMSEAKESAPISPTCALPITADEYGRMPFKDEKARLANVAIQLRASPGLGAVFIIYLPKKESKSLLAARVAKIKGYLSKNLGIAETRLRFVFAEQDSYRTRIYLIPPGAMGDFLGVQTDSKVQRPNEE